MSELEPKDEPQTPQVGEGSQSPGKKPRKSRLLLDVVRCEGRLPNGRRCEAARLKHSLYCVFHDPEMVERRLKLMAGIPYEHPDEVQRLLAAAVEAVKKKRLSPRAGNTLGYLASLLVQNQERVGKERSRVNEAQFYAELQAGVNEIMAERAERLAKSREAREAKEAEEQPG